MRCLPQMPSSSCKQPSIWSHAQLEGDSTKLTQDVCCLPSYLVLEASNLLMEEAQKQPQRHRASALRAVARALVQWR